MAVYGNDNFDNVDDIEYWKEYMCDEELEELELFEYIEDADSPKWFCGYDRDMYLCTDMKDCAVFEKDKDTGGCIHRTKPYKKTKRKIILGKDGTINEKEHI